VFFLDPTIKADPALRWNLSDRIFFTHGACHVLAGVFLNTVEADGLKARWIKPVGGQAGNHIFVTNGVWAFDARGFSAVHRLIDHFSRGWRSRYSDWLAEVVDIDFDLLNTEALNRRGMRGPEQYLFDPIPRAEKFIAKKFKIDNPITQLHSPSPFC